MFLQVNIQANVADKPGSISNLFSETLSELPSDLFGSLLCEHKPHQWLSVHQKEVAAAYKGLRRSEGPPHICGVAENAFQDTLHSKWLPYKTKGKNI